MSNPWTNGRQGVPIAGHLDLLGGPCQSGEIVQDDVKSHSRRSAVCSGIAHEGWGKSLSSEWFHVAFNQGLAYGIGGLRTSARLLSHIVVFRDAIHAAGGHINEALYSRVADKFGEMNRTFVIDFVSNRRRQLASRVIGQFSHVNDGLNVLQVLDPDVTKILGERQRRRSGVPVERTFFVEASIQANDFIALPDQLRC